MNKSPKTRDLIWDESIQLTRDSLQHAVGWIDADLGQGYAKKHPQILAAFISATMNAYAGSVIADAIQNSSGDKWD